MSISAEVDNVVPLKSTKAKLSDSDYTRQFENLLKPYLDSLFRVAYRFYANVDDAEDLVQDLLIKLYARRIDFSEIEQIQPWLVKAMYRHYIDQIRRAKRSPLNYLDDEDVNAQENTQISSPHDAMLRSQQQEMIQDALAKLSEEHRMLIILCDIEGYSMPEVQLILDLATGTIKSRLHRARMRLRELLKQQ